VTYKRGQKTTKRPLHQDDIDMEEKLLFREVFQKHVKIVSKPKCRRRSCSQETNKGTEVDHLGRNDPTTVYPFQGAPPVIIDRMVEGHRIKNKVVVGNWTIQARDTTLSLLERNSQ